MFGSLARASPYDVPVLNRRNAPAFVILLVVMFAAPVLVDVTWAAALRYAAWSALWWAFGYLVVAKHTAGGLERATIGALVGMAVQLANWCLWQLIGAPSLTVVGGVVALVVGVLLHCRAGSPSRPSPQGHEPNSVPESVADASGAPTGSLWLLVASTSWLGWLLVGFSRHQTRPPGPSTMYQDLYWHLGIVAELKRAVLPTVPQAEVLGQLNYHWLSNAYMASGSLGSFTSTSDVALRLWYLPVVALVLASCLVVGRRLSGTWVAGNVAVVLLVVPSAILPFAWKGATGPTSPFVWASPSQIFGLAFTLGATWLFVPVLRGARPTKRGLALLVAAAFLCAGSKSSILPTFLCGALAVGVLFIRRAAIRRGAAVVAGVCLVGIALAMPLFAGGSAGSKIRLFSSFRREVAYKDYVHLPTAFDHGPFVMPYIATGGGFLLVTGLALALLAQYGYVATSLLLGRVWTKDPMPTFLAASFVASLAAYLLIDHTGASQGYFPLGALPLLAVLAGWGVSVVWERCRTARWRLVGSGFVIGGAALLLLRWASGTAKPERDSIPVAVFTVAVAALVLVGAALMIGRRSPLVGIGVLLGAALTFPAYTVVKNAGGSPFTPVSNDAPWTVSADETAAAAWVREHSGQTDVVATNVHCRVARTSECDARAFWVSALTERRAFIESWGYSDPAQRQAGRHGLRATSQPFEDRELFALNEKVFHDPDRATVEQLQRRGVRWLYADTAASDVSPDLADYADAVHHSGTVTVYRLD